MARAIIWLKSEERTKKSSRTINRIVKESKITSFNIILTIITANCVPGLQDILKTVIRGAWVPRSIKYPTLDFSSGLDFRVLSSSHTGHGAYIKIK